MVLLLFLCISGLALQVFDLFNVVFPDKGQGQLWCHDSAQGSRPDRSEYSGHGGQDPRRTHLSRHILEGKLVE